MLKYSFFLLRHSIGNIRKPNIVEMLILPKLIYRHNLKSYWSSSKVFYTYIQAYLKIYMERHRASWTARSILKNNNKVPSIKVYCISMVISLLKSRDITLPTKVHLVKAMVFPVVMYGCESWTIKKAECRRIDAFELWYWRGLLRVPWTARRSNQSILKEICPGCSLEGLMLKLKLQYFGHLMRRAYSFEKTLMLGKTEGGRRGPQRMRWLDGITDSMDMGWVGSGSWWWTGRPDLLQFMGSQRIGYDWVTELNR